MASSQTMSDHVSCGVCMEHYDRTDHIPKLLPCQHTFCLACLLSLERSSSTMSIKCPMCCSQYEISPYDLTTIGMAMDIAEQLQQQSSKSLPCSTHADKDSVVVCIKCLTGICAKCVNKHKDHQLEDISFAKTLLTEALVNKTQKQQFVLQTEMAAASSVNEITRAEDDIKEMCTHLISVITAWQSDQLSIIGDIKTEAATREEKLKALNAKLEASLQIDIDISALIRILRKEDKVNFPSMRGNTYNFLAARQTMLAELTAIITSDNMINSKFLQKQTSNAIFTCTLPHQSIQQKPNLQIPAGASRVIGYNQQQESASVRKGKTQLKRGYNQIAFPGRTVPTNWDESRSAIVLVQKQDTDKFDKEYFNGLLREHEIPGFVQSVHIPLKIPLEKEFDKAQLETGIVVFEVHQTCNLFIRQFPGKACPLNEVPPPAEPHSAGVEISQVPPPKRSRTEVRQAPMYGPLKGNQPRGDMKTREHHSRLPGYPDVGVIVIDYHIYDGYQTDEHPNPGKRFRGLWTTAYLPNSSEGRKVLRLLRIAFDYRLTFTIGPDNCVTWNGIHHKTNIEGGPDSLCYPDPGYLKRVLEELAAIGIQEQWILARYPEDKN